MSHEKKHLVQPVILTKTRFIGFNRQPLQDDGKDTRVTGLPAPSSDYSLADGNRWIDARRKR